MVFVLVSIKHSITIFLASFLAAIEILSLCTSTPIFNAGHKRVFLSGGFQASTQPLLHNGRPFVLASCGQVLDKLDNFHLLPSITQSQCKFMREREIAQSERTDLNHLPPGPTPGGQRLSV